MEKERHRDREEANKKCQILKKKEKEKENYIPKD